MAQFKTHKFVAALPSQLEADAIYFVRSGSGFDLYVTNHSGTIVAYPANKGDGAQPGWNISATGTGTSQNIIMLEEVPADSLLVFVNGLRQSPQVHYTTSGTSLTITAPLASNIYIEKPSGNPGKNAIGISDAPLDGKVYGRKDGAWTEASAGASISSEKYPETPWAKRVCSRWKSGGASSAQITATSLRAQPFNTMGRKISAIEFHIQGSISAGQVLHIGIYNSDPETGMPTNLLWQSGAYDISSAGAGTKSITMSPITPTTDRVWVAYYLSTGATQFVIGSSSGIGEREFGLSPGGGVNTALQALLCSSAWTGSMPETYNYDMAGLGLSTNGNYINFFLQLPPN